MSLYMSHVCILSFKFILFCLFSSSKFMQTELKTLQTTEYSIFLISFPSLKFTIFLCSLSHTVLSTLLILAVCRTRVTNELSKYDLARYESPSSSVVRASDRCYGRSWVRFPSETQIFSLSHARDKLNIPSFSLQTFCFQLKPTIKV